MGEGQKTSVRRLDWTKLTLRAGGARLCCSVDEQVRGQEAEEGNRAGRDVSVDSHSMTLGPPLTGEERNTEGGAPNSIQVSTYRIKSASARAAHNGGDNGGTGGQSCERRAVRALAPLPSESWAVAANSQDERCVPVCALVASCTSFA